MREAISLDLYSYGEQNGRDDYDDNKIARYLLSLDDNASSYCHIFAKRPTTKWNTANGIKIYCSIFVQDFKQGRGIIDR